MLKRLLRTGNSSTIILIRIMVGAIFISEGFQKFIFPELKGVGLFAQIGLPIPEILGYFVGAVEISCGLLILIGFLTRVASVPLVIIMLGAINLAKLPALMNSGVWETAAAVRTDFALLLGAMFLLFEGGGRWSIDRTLLHRLSDNFFNKFRFRQGGFPEPSSNYFTD